MSVANEDVVSYNGATFSIAFDGSDVGLGKPPDRRIRLARCGFAALLPSTPTARHCPASSGTIDDSDVIRFNVIDWSHVPKVLLETANMRNPAEAARLEQPGVRQRIARGIALGLARFLAE